MNSEKLKERFKDEYSDFFKENSKVFSMPLVLNWASDVNEEYKWIHIKQKIPLRIYLWVNEIKEKNIKFNKINYFDINEDVFVKEKLVQYSPVISQVKNVFTEKFDRKNDFDHWLEFNVLSESWKGQGSWFMSVLIALLIIWYKNNYKKIYQNLDNISNDEKIIDFLNKDTFFDDVLRSTLKLNRLVDRPISVVIQTTSLFNSTYPVVSFVQKNYNTKEVDQIKLFWYKTNCLSTNLSKVPYIPIDYGLIYTWMPVSVSQILYSNKHALKKENTILKNMSTFFWDDIQKLKEEDRPLFYDKFIDNKTDDEKNKAFIEIYLNLMWTLSLKILNNMVNFYKEPYQEYLSRKFLENVNKINRFNLLTKKCSTHFKKFIKEIENNFKWSHIDLAIAANDTMLMWWNAIFAMKVEGNRGKLLKTIDTLEKNDTWIKLVYANWLDWIEDKWLIVEQDLKNKHFSDFINHDSLIVIDSKWNKKIIWNDFLEDKESRNWLFLDLTKNKILLNWEKLTSKELKSQNTTIEILLKLLENKWEFISNKDLSISSYSTNKNDMSSKIISPLQKLIKRENNIDFKITITGTSSNFNMKLEENILNINIVKYIS